MEIRKGTKADLKEIIEIVQKTVSIMESEGNDQWNRTYPRNEDFLADVEAGSLYTAIFEGNVAGSITVDQIQAEEYKNASWRKDEPCFVFHRLAVDPEIRGEGIASRLIAFAEDHAVNNGILYMRTDTYSLNKKAQRLFEKNGYVKAGTIFMDRENPFYCYDKLLD
ncbi:GNAT family N-acetyltransferase [Cytobacillus firmus]|uniref:GNAT family N-acetyltransferase n=1 Tax=Cytobacillus firmus TaxID=1399 RepID=UPI001CFD5B0B|nr:GNAT family N-acetyltransferase [Cytobacillus firmus]URT69428.1 GNAT family N-acetyltransferase [Cytobacillus firmus]WHY60328.1 GNAT family N-acetyltransferase [Cytobacillus firmus]